MAALVSLVLAGDPSVPAAVALFLLIGAAAGVRTAASAALGLAQLRGDAAVMMTARTGATQVGYLLGAVAGGGIITLSGYRALGFAPAAGLLASIGVLASVRDAGGSVPGDGGGCGGATGAAGEPELGVDVGEMSLDRPLAQEQRTGDLDVRHPLGDQPEHLPLSRGQ